MRVAGCLKISLAALLLILVACCDRIGGKQQATPEPEPVEVSDLTEQASRWADSVCATLTLRQKVAQLFMPALFASSDEWNIRLIRQYADSCIGGIILLKGDSVGASTIADSLSVWSKVAPFVAIDAEWGLAMRLADAPLFPANSKISQTTDDQLMYDYGYELARECRLLGINMVLGPVVDVSVPNSFMRRRSLGEDPRRVADLALAYARGLEDGNVISVAKHFPGHGSVTTDSHKRKGVIGRSLHEMDSIDLYPFRKWVEQRLTGVMVGHLAVPSIDSGMLPSAVSKTVINDLLRTDLGFSGLIITDAINMKGAEGYDSADAVAAGADMVVAPEKTFREVDRVVQAVQAGRLSLQDLDQHVHRVLFYKYLLNARGAGSPDRDDSSVSGLRSAQTDTIINRLSENS